jgi:retinol dehydrogenase 12
MARVNLDDLEGEKRYLGWQTYAQSKLANVLFTYELARRLEGTSVTVNALHPGVVATNFAANNGSLSRLFRRAFDLVCISAEEGAQTSIYLSISPEVPGVTGKYFERARPVCSSQASYDSGSARRLWDVSAAMTELAEFAKPIPSNPGSRR